MSIKDRLSENSARYQRANPVTSTFGRVMNVIGVVLFGALVVLGAATTNLSMALLGVVGLVPAVLAIWLSSLGRRRRGRTATAGAPPRLP